MLPIRYPLVIVVALGLAAPAQGADWTGKPIRALTEAESLRLTLSRPAVQSLTKGRIALARSDITEASRWPNPELEFSREQVDRQPGDSTEGFYWLSQRLELSGQRGLRTQAAEHRVRAATLGTQADRANVVADTRADFYRVLHHQERLGAIEDWTGRMRAIETVIRKRQSAGEVSGYDGLRLSREQSSAQAALRKEQAGYRRAWAVLASRLGGPDAIAERDGVTGRLMPDPPLPLSTLLPAIETRPDIARLAQEAAAHDLERRAGEPGWVPELTLGIGRKTVDDDLGFDSGPMVAAGVTIPLFDRGQAEQQRASANAAIARSQHLLARAAAEGEIVGLWGEVSELTGPAWEQHRVARDEAARLIQIAEVAYRGGEIGVLELLDAYRGAYEAQYQALETAAAARQGSIELDRLTGGPVQ